MRATTQVGASICLSVFSLVSIILLLPSSQVSTQLQKITLGTTLWDWGSSEDDEYEGDGVSLVVFGDSWVDDSDDGEKKGRSWTEVLCEEINCTSHLNFAVSQAIDAYPDSAPTGAMISNAIYVSSLATSPTPPLETLSNELLPDLAAQIQQYIALPPPSSRPKETLFLISFGVWDIYNFAGLDYALGQNVTDETVHELFSQVNILYSHYSQNLTAPIIEEASNSSSKEPHIPPFRVIIPKLFEPTLLPGWLTQRPVPLSPSSVAEHQKNAVHLASRWNTLVEDTIKGWIKEPPLPPTEAANVTMEEVPTISTIERDVFYYDVAQYLLDIIVEHQLEDEGLSDASGLGKGDSSFESVYEPCVRDVDGEYEGRVDVNGMIVCKEPGEHLFWDSFNLGSVAKEGVGREVGKMVKAGMTMKQIWAQKGS